MSTDLIKSYNDVPRRNRLMRDGTYAEVMSPASESLFRTTFAKVIAAGVDPDLFTQVGALGTGITYSQAGGNLVINSGTTANSELILRSVDNFSGPHELRFQTILSQRIVNNNFYVELVDVIGDGLTFTINSAVSVTINIPKNPFSAVNIGQSVSIGAIAGAAGVPGRYAIASVSGNAVTFTVAGWPATGSGTCSVFGWNFHRSTYTGTTATNLNYDTARRGWSSGDTIATINTSASPGHLAIMTAEDGMAGLLDQLVASSTAVATAQRASRVVNMPDEKATLYVQLRCTNGSVAPATTTAWTVGMLSMTEYVPINVAVNTIRPQPINSVAPVTVQNTPNIGTVTTVTTVGTVTNITNAGTPTAPATPYFVNSLATTNGALILTGTSGLSAFYATNIGATAAFVKLYNKATAPTVGTDIPEMIVAVPAAVSGVPGVAELTPGFNAYRFALGLGIAITGAVADSDTTAVAAGQVKVKLSRTI